MKTIRNLFLGLLLTLSVSACGTSKGEGIYFRNADVSREDNGKTVYMQGMIKDPKPEMIPETYAIVYPDVRLVEIFQNQKLVNTVKYRNPKATESQIVQERGPWSLTEQTLYWGNGEVQTEFKSSRNNLWTETLYNADGTIAEITKYRDGVEQTDAYRGKGRIFDSKFVNPKRKNDKGLQETIIEYYDENGVIRIKEYWQANFITQNGETFQSGETLRLRELNNSEGEVAASWYGKGDARNNPAEQRFFDRLYQEAIDITAADQYRGDEIGKEADKNRVGTITNEGTDKESDGGEEEKELPTLTPDENGVINIDVSGT